METKGYELPNVDEGTTPERAGEMLNKLYAEGLGDLSHPLMDGGHVQHKDFLKRMDELQTIKMSNDVMLTDLEKAMQRALDHRENQQTSRVEEAQDLMTELVERGYRDDTIPSDVTRYEVDLLRLQLQVAEKQYDEVIPKIEADLRKLGAPPAMHDTLKALRSAPGHLDSYKSQLAEGLLFWIRDQKRAKYGRVDIY